MISLPSIDLNEMFLHVPLVPAIKANYVLEIFTPYNWLTHSIDIVKIN